MTRVPVTSSDVSSVMYDTENMLLEVDFVKNGPYVYFHVPERIYLDFMAAESKGKFVYHVLRQGYNYNKGPMAAAKEVGTWIPSFEVSEVQP